MLDRRGRALPNDYARLRWRTEPRIAFGPQRIIPAPANRAPRRTRRRLAFLHGALMFRPHHDYGVVYSTIALTWGRKPAGGFNWTDAAWSSACIKSPLSLNRPRPSRWLALRLGGSLCASSGHSSSTRCGKSRSFICPVISDLRRLTQVPSAQPCQFQGIVVAF